MEDNHTKDTPGAPHGLPHDQQPAGAPGKDAEYVDPTSPSHLSNAGDQTGKCPPDSPSMRFTSSSSSILHLTSDYNMAYSTW